MSIYLNNPSEGGGGAGYTTDTSNLVPYIGAVSDLLLGSQRLSVTATTIGTLQGILMGTGGSIFSIGSTGGSGQYLISDGDNTYSWTTIGTGSHDAVTIGVPSSGLVLSGQELTLKTAGVGVDGAVSATNWASFSSKLGDITTGIISGLLPITTNNTRYALGGAVQLSINTANIWATTFSGSNFYGGLHSGGTFLASAMTLGTLQGVIVGTGGSLTAIGTGATGAFFYHAGNNTYAYANTQASLPTTTTGVLGVLLPVTTDNTRYVLGGAVQLSLNTATIWATTISSTNHYGGTHSGGTFLASALTIGTLQGIAMGTQGSIVGIATGAVGTFLSHSGGNIYAWSSTQASLPTIATGIISGLLPITTDNTRYALGGAVQLSLNTAILWGTTLSGTNGYITTVSSGTIYATSSSATTLKAITVTCSAFYSTSTSVVYSAVSPIMTVPGQVGVDATTTSGSQFRFYSDAQYCLPAYQSKSFCIVNPVGAATYQLWRTPYAYTLKTVYALVSGGTVTGALYEADGDGINCVTSTVNAAITGTTTTASNIVNAGIDAGNFLNWITTATGGTPTQLTLTANFAVDANT